LEISEEMVGLDLTKAGANARDKHMENWTRPFVAPSDEGFGAFSFTSIMLALGGEKASANGKINKAIGNTYEKAKHPILDMTSMMPMPIQSIAVTCASNKPVVSSTPLRAMTLSKGMRRNV
jgi:hypothetical protein